MAVSAGALPVNRAEVSVEIGEVVEARIERDVGHGIFRLEQSAGGLSEPEPDEVILEGHSHVLAEEAADGLRMKRGHFCDSLE